MINRLFIAILFSLIATSSFCLPVSAQYDGTVSAEPSTQSVRLGSSFNVEIWIRELPCSMEHFSIDISWNPSMVKYVSHTTHIPNPQWSITVDTTQVNSGQLEVSAWDNAGTNFQNDFNWLTISFECLDAGYSQISFPDNSWHDPNWMTRGFKPISASIIQISPNPVGGEVTSINPYAMMAPWITIAIAALTIGFAITKRKLFLH